MADEGTAEADDGPFDDEADNGDGYEMEESYEQEQEMANYDEIEGGPDIDEDNGQSDNNEVEVDDSNEVPNQSGSSSSSHSQVAPDAGTSSITLEQPDASNVVQQIQTISSGTEAGSSTQMHGIWRQSAAPQRQQQQSSSSHLLLMQQGYEETGDDSIVPSTPTLYAQRRTDGFSEVVSSPHPQVPHTVRFTFSEQQRGSSSSQSSLVPGEGIDDTRIDLSQLEEAGGSGSRTVPNTPLQSSPARDREANVDQSTSTSSSSQPQEAIAGPSHGGEGSVPEITITDAGEMEDNETVDDNATTSDAPEDDRDKEEGVGSEEGEGTDGVSSEGEKGPTGSEGVEVSFFLFVYECIKIKTDFVFFFDLG